MKIPPSWQTAACGAGLFLTASAACFCAAEQLWLTAAVCVAAFVGLYASLHHRQTRQIRLLRSFIRGIRHSGLKEIPRFVPEESAHALGLEREIEHTLAAYRQQLFDEATRQKYYQLLLDHVDTGIATGRRKTSCSRPHASLWITAHGYSSRSKTYTTCWKNSNWNRGRRSPGY